MSTAPSASEPGDERDFARFWAEAAELRNELAHRRIGPDEAAARMEAAGWNVQWKDLFQLARVYSWPELARPLHVTRFVTALATKLEAESAVDPFVVSPAVLGAVAASNHAQRLVGITPSEDTAGLARRMSGPSLEWRVGLPGRFEFAADERFEWVFSSPPMGMQSSSVDELLLPPGLDPRTARSEVGLVAIARAAQRTEHGLVVLATERFLWARIGSLWRDYFSGQGFHMSAAVSVADGLAPASGVQTVLCVFTREPAEQLFVGRVTPTTDLRSLASNLTSGTAAEVPELGAFVQASEYRGWASFAARLALERSLRRSRVPLRPLSDLATSIKSGRSDTQSPDDASANALYFDSRVVRKVTTSPPVPAKVGSAVPFYELQLDPTQANAEFVARWLNSDDGRLMVDSVAVGSAQKRVQREALGSIHVPIPSIEEQAKGLALATRLAGLSQEVDALQNRLWKQPWAATELADELDSLNESDPLRAWVDRLPFPLASIVMRYVADADDEVKLRRLLHFFEAFAELGVTTLLSALLRNPDLWEQERDTLRDPGPSGRHPLAEGQFGGWTHLGSHLAKVFRTQLNDIREDDNRRVMFGVGSKDFVEMLTQKALWATIDEARPLRNIRGHGGEVGKAELRRRLERVEQLLGDLRDLTNRGFARVELIQPGSSTRGHGVRVYARSRGLTGPLTTFVERKITAHANVDLIGDSLCFVDRVDLVEDALELIPLVRLMPSPETEENAAFFFNKREGSGFKFVSYHFAGEAEAPLDDPGLAAVVNDLLP